MATSSMGDGRFDEDEHILHQPVPAPSPADLWTLVDTTGDGRADAVVLAADGVRIFRQDENGDFAPAGGELILTAFGHDDVAGGWQVHEHMCFLAATTTGGRLDVLGCHDVGVWVALQNRERAFAEPVHVLGDFGADQDRSSVEEHPPAPHAHHYGRAEGENVHSLNRFGTTGIAADAWWATAGAAPRRVGQTLCTTHPSNGPRVEAEATRRSTPGGGSPGSSRHGLVVPKPP
ncbi:VCBS repeat-containing protein [Streptomyces sp. CB02115]|uniref:VCBS repeat-containing protein n=1 Tax=Streptomyces sp. CB02115 TaxID=1703939 RepID=UPI0011614D5A|nr:VCBS repeat-containing protein [Streptomyces sp. CB02115]